MLLKSEKTVRMENPGDSSSHGTALMQGELSSTPEAIEAELAGWWKELLAVEHVAPDDDFFELGGHSLIGVALFDRIEKTYGIELGLSLLFEARTVRQLAETISDNLNLNHGEAKRWSTVVPIQPKGTRAPLFWIPGGYGTSVLAFKEVSLLLGPDQPVYGFESKMPEPDEEMESIPDRAARFIEEMRLLQPQGPYFLLGFCGGGFVAFEMAQQLAAKGQTLGLLGIIECYDKRHPSTWHGKVQFRIERAVWRFQRLLRRGPKGLLQQGMLLSRSLALHVRRVKARLLGTGVPSLLPDEVDIYEKARGAVDRYQPASYPGKSVVMIGRDTYDFCGLSRSVDPRLIWCKLSRGGSEILRIPGDHMEMLQPPIMYRLAEELRRLLVHSTG